MSLPDDLVDRLPPGCDLLAEIDDRRSDDSATHRHPHGEVYVLRSGQLVSSSDGARWLIPAGFAYWVPAQVPHGGVLTDACGVRVYVSAEPALTSLLPAEPFAFRVTAVIEALMTRWSRDARDGLAGRAIDRHMLAVLADEMAAARARPVILPLPAHPTMRSVISAWSVECDERAGLDRLAERCRMSRRTFTRQFRAETGLSPGAWMQAARVVRGCELMAAGVSVTETAFRLGYDSPTSFYNLCRRVTGRNPSDLSRLGGDRGERA